MQNIAQQQSNARNNAQHYDESCDFMELFDSGTFDEEVQTAWQWQGLVRDDAGMLQVHAEFVYDVVDGEVQESGKGWWL